MPAIKRVMDAAIVGMFVVDLVLTGTLLTRGRRRAEAESPQQAIVGARTRPSHAEAATMPATSPTASEALFILLRGPDICGAQPYVSPSSNASEWDFGGSANWADWNELAASMPTSMSYSYENPYPASQKVASPTSAVP